VGYLDTIQQLNGIISEIDIFISFAKVAISSQNEYIRPKLYPSG
jgi:DNA mismatch repair ATPase MutS